MVSYGEGRKDKLEEEMSDTLWSCSVCSWWFTADMKRAAHPPQKGGEKVTTGSETAVWTFIALHQELSGTGWRRLILMADCKSWCTPLSKLWTDLCSSGLHGAWEVMKPAWNTVENIYSPPFPPRMTTALCKSKLDCLCWLPNCQWQKKHQVSM